MSVPIGLGYRHKGVVSDRWYCGKPAVFSGSARRGAVREEPWECFSRGKPVRDDGYPSALAANEVLRRARELVGRRYHIFDLNCDHVVAIVHGQKPESPQVHATVAIALIALSLGLLVAAR
ncbi:MAG TPA: lecithin retinol acyltransferase family protein [Steroidobacteraceae bacterium]|nr:lecithin retinol acyltransferase family protein [Steroidobacteraceae bacterium]